MMTASKVVSGISPGLSRAEGGSKYGFDSLKKAGDSVFIPGGDLKSISGSLTHRRRMGRGRWTCRVIEDGEKWGEEYAGVPGVAVWFLGNK